MRTLPDNLVDRLPLAASAFAERGFNHTRVEDVAEACGIPKATLYYYFSGKEDILAFLLNKMLERLAAEIDQIVASATPAALRLGAVVRAQLTVMSEEPDICRVLLEDLGRAVRIPEVADAVERAYYVPMRQLLDDGRGDGSVRGSVDPDLIAAALFGCVTTAALHLIVREGAFDPAAVADQIAAFVLHGAAG